MKKKIEEVTEAKKELPAEGVTEKMVGTIVHYHKEIETSKGRAMETVAAMITRPSPKGDGNFQTKDGAADLYVFTSFKGGSNETKFGIRFSPEKAPNRWTFIE